MYAWPTGQGLKPTRWEGGTITDTDDKQTADYAGAASTSGVLVVSDDPLRRVGITTVISHSKDLAVVGEAQGAREATRLCSELRPNLMLVDLETLDAGGLEAIRTMPAEHPETSVLVLVANEDEDTLLEVVRTGAAGYAPRDFTETQLLNALRSSARGMSPMNRELAMRLLRQLSRETSEGQTPPALVPAAPEALDKSPLTPREVEVVYHIAKGKTNRQIADDLHLSLSTVKRHLEHIIAKLKVSDRTEAAVEAARLGLLTNRRHRAS